MIARLIVTLAAMTPWLDGISVQAQEREEKLPSNACEEFARAIRSARGSAAAGISNELAQQRRAELKQLIMRDPARALTYALSAEERKSLSTDRVQYLEEEIAGEGTVGPLMAPRCPDPHAAPSISLTVRGQVLRVFLHGNQILRRQWWKVPVQGIVVDGCAALREPTAGPAVPVPPRAIRSAPVTRRYHPDDVRITHRDGFDVIEMSGCSQLEDEPGTPGLPAQILHVAIPSGAEVHGLRVAFKEERLRAGVMPSPVQPSWPIQSDITPRFVPPRPDAYGSDTVVPKSVAEIVGDHNLRGYRYVSIRVNPLRYLGAAQELSMVTEVNLAIDYEPPWVRPTAFHNAAAESAAATVRGLVVNPADVEGPAMPGTEPEDMIIPAADANEKLGFTSRSFQVPENSPEGAVVTVERTKAGNDAASAEYYTANGTAAAGADFASVTGTLYWAAKESSVKTFVVPILDDTSTEGNETFYVYLRNITGSNPGLTNATVTIADDDAPGVISFTASSNVVAENAGGVILSVQRLNGKTGSASVQYFTSNGTAVAGSDYGAATGTLTWADGDSTTKTFAVTILNDNVYQGTHRFTVHLRNAMGASLVSPSNATVYITEDDPMPGQIDYLIVTSSALAPAFTNLALHRQTFNGYAVQVRTVSEIVTNYAGADTQAKIRACISDYVTIRNLSQVVLGGDDTVVPVRRCFVSCSSYTENAMPTDLYYSGLDGTWDEDGDGTYGEADTAAGDEGDLAYDVVVGRIPVRTVSDANAYINKVIRYDMNPPHHLARKFMMSGHILWDSYTGTNRPSDSMNDGHMPFRDNNHPTVSDAEMWIRRKFRDQVQTTGWNADAVGCMFDTLTSWDSTIAGDYPCSPSNLQANYSLGWNFVINFTHGNTTILQHEGGNFSSGNAAGMTNAAVIFYTGACLSGAFDSAEPSLSEAMVRNPNGGSLVYLGCSRYGWGEPDPPPAENWSVGGPSASYLANFLTQIFANKTIVVGKAFADHKAAYAGSSGYNGAYRWIQFGLNLQGDPALTILGVKPFVTVEAGDALASEPGTDSARLIIHRYPATNTLTVHLAWSGSATLSGANSDIAESLPASVAFANGESDKVLTITPVDDALSETDETVVLTLISDAAYQTGSSNSAVVTIVDNDNTNVPTVAIAAWDPFAAEEGCDPGCFEFTRTGNAAGNLTINCTVSGTATPNDYQEILSSSITLPAGHTHTNIVITPVDDALPEGAETVAIVLQAGAYTVGQATATVTIADNESPHTVTVTALDADARENSSDTASFRISRTGHTALPLNVWFAIGGTCTPGSDYMALSSPATIASGCSYVDLLVIPLDDSLREPPESVSITIMPGPAYYVIGTASQAVVTVADDDNQPPTVTMTSPSSGFSYESGDLLVLAATAFDDFGVSRVEFLCDGLVIGADTNAPYEYSWVGLNGSHALAARATDMDGAMTTSATVHVTGVAIPAGPGNGYFVEWWTNIPGTTVSSLTTNAGYPANPSGSAISNSPGGTFRFSLNQDNYGTRMRAFFLAPKTGSYIFYVASDDHSELWLSSSEGTTQVARIAHVNGYTGTSEWNKYSSQKSAPITLAAGAKYYIEVLHKEGTGSDHVLIGVELPGSQMERPMPVHRLEPWRDLAVATDTNIVTFPMGTTAVFYVRLTQPPMGGVTVTVARVTGDTGISVQAGSTLVFDSSNWSLYRPVTLTAAEDPSAEVKTAVIRCASADAVSASVTAVALRDTDKDGIPDLQDDDDDNDGMPDAWENLHGLGSTTSNATADADGDRLCNWCEYVAGTVPTNPRSFLGIATVSNQPHFTLYFFTVSNRLYGVDYCPDLLLTQWVELTSGIPGNDKVQSFTDPTIGPIRFYRIKVTLP